MKWLRWLFGRPKPGMTAQARHKLNVRVRIWRAATGVWEEKKWRPS